MRDAPAHLLEHNGKYGLGLDRVFLVGASAGGFMAMFLGVAQNSGDPEISLPEESGVAGVVSIVGGGTDCYEAYQLLRNRDVEFWRNVGSSLVDDHDRTEELMETVCPIKYFDVGDPPVFLAHGGLDEFGPPTTDPGATASGARFDDGGQV